MEVYSVAWKGLVLRCVGAFRGVVLSGPWLVRNLQIDR